MYILAAFCKSLSNNNLRILLSMEIIKKQSHLSFTMASFGHHGGIFKLHLILKDFGWPCHVHSWTSC